MDEMDPNPAAVTSTPASDDTFLLAWLFDRDAACPLCQYNLRRLTSPRCPECGEALRLGVSLVEPYLKAWIALVVAVLPPAGLGALFLVIFTIETMRYRGGGLSRMTFWDAMGFLYIIGCIPLSVVTLAMRRRFQRLHRNTQNLLACIAWVVLVVATISLIAQIR